MDDKLSKSLQLLLFHFLRHCSRFRLIRYDLSAVTEPELCALASAMIDYFEHELERLPVPTVVSNKKSAPADVEDAPTLDDFRKSLRGQR